MAPKIAMSMAPPVTSRVPQKDHRVNGSLSINVAHMELKTKPAA